MINIEKIYLSPPSISKKEKKYVQKALDSNWITSQGFFIDKFSRKLAKYTGAKYCLLTNSGTSALHLALLTMNLNIDDEVMISSHTFISSANVVKYINAKVIVIGSEKLTFNIDIDELINCIENRKKNGAIPKVLIVTHIYGMPSDMVAIKEICDQYEIKIIEDAAESLGSTINDRQTGTFGDCGIFSFNGNKIITTSGGGALVTNNIEIFEKASYLANQAKSNFSYFHHLEVGYNYRMSNILAAIGLAQLKKIDKKIEKRRLINSWYRQLLLEYFQLDILFQKEITNFKSNFWLTAIVTKDGNSNLILQKLNDNMIEARQFWNPMHLQPILSKSDYFGKLEIDNYLFEYGICLPSGDNLTYKQVTMICKIIKSCFN